MEAAAVLPEDRFGCDQSAWCGGTAAGSRVPQAGWAGPFLAAPRQIQERNEGQGRAFVGIKPSRGCATGADMEVLTVWVNLEVTGLRLSQAEQDTDVPFPAGRTTPNLVQT